MAFGQTGAIRTDCYLMLMSSVVLSTGAQTPVLAASATHRQPLYQVERT